MESDANLDDLDNYPLDLFLGPLLITKTYSIHISSLQRPRLIRNRRTKENTQGYNRVSTFWQYSSKCGRENVGLICFC